MKQAKLNQIGVNHGLLIAPCSQDPEVLDELKVGDWLHLELMNINGHQGETTYWLRVGGNEFSVIVDGSGSVRVRE